MTDPEAWAKALRDMGRGLNLHRGRLERLENEVRNLRDRVEELEPPPPDDIAYARQLVAQVHGLTTDPKALELLGFLASLLEEWSDD